jgi:hypothetical protein
MTRIGWSTSKVPAPFQNHLKPPAHSFKVVGTPGLNPALRAAENVAFIFTGFVLAPRKYADADGHQGGEVIQNGIQLQRLEQRRLRNHFLGHQEWHEDWRQNGIILCRLGLA